MNSEKNKSKELEDSDLKSVAGGYSSDDQPPPEDDGREPTGVDTKSDDINPADDPLASPER